MPMPLPLPILTLTRARPEPILPTVPTVATRPHPGRPPLPPLLPQPKLTYTKQPGKSYPAATRNKAKAMIISGASATRVGAAIGISPITIRKWVERFGWGRLRQESQAVVAQVVTRTVGAVNGAGVRQRVAEGLERDASAYANRSEPKTLDGLRAHSEIARTLVSASAPVFGWTDQITESLVVEQDCAGAVLARLDGGHEPTPAQVVDHQHGSHNASCIQSEPTPTEPMTNAESEPTLSEEMVSF